MIKTIALIKRKDDITRKDFAKHYEETHAPLALKHLNMIQRYIRNHVTSVLVPHSLDFDCISQFWFESIEAAIQVQEFSQSSDGQILRDDEARFMDSSKPLSFLVEERASSIDGPAAVKAIALLKMKPGHSRDAFITHYENVHAPLIIEHSIGISRYVRNYVVPMGDEESPFDCVTEIWYRDQQSYEQSMAARLSDTGKIIADDETSFLDPSQIAFFLVDERISNT